MEWMGNLNKYLNLVERGSFVVRKGNRFNADISKQENREALLLAAQAFICYPGDYPENIEVRVVKDYRFRLPEIGSFTGGAGELRTLPRLAALYVISRFLATPIDKALWCPIRAPELSDEQIIRLHENAENAEARKDSNWVSRWRH